MTEGTELSALSRRNIFQFLEADGEVGAEATVEVRLSCRWLSSLWVKPAHRGKGVAKELLRAVIDEFGHEALYLHVLAFDGRPVKDEKLIELYSGFGFAMTEVPGIMKRTAA